MAVSGASLEPVRRIYEAFLDAWEGWRVKMQDCMELDLSPGEGIS